MTWTVAVAALAAAGMLLEGVVLYLLLRQHGRTLIDHDRLTERFATLEQAVHSLTDAVAMEHGAEARNGQRAAPPPALVPLQIGTPAPRFELPRIDGSARRLEDLPGNARVIVFFDPQCGFCQAMAPAIGELADASAMVLISRGSVEEHRGMREQHGWQCEVLLEPDGSVATAYGTRATPTGYVIDEAGRIASPLLVGADALLAAARDPQATALTDRAPHEQQQASREVARAPGLRVKDIQHSRIPRNGLDAGTPAPEFTLPDLTDSTRSYAEFRGSRILLVFSDPDCGPCQELTSQLALLDKSPRTEGPQIVMISRGDPQANREKAAEHSIGFPVLLQKRWEISKKYGIFATPVGYLISPDGVIEQEVAIGSDAILHLASA